MTSFIGRDDDVVALQRLVQDNRLVTLTGVGGVGKSSLALTVADALTFPDGVWLLELAPITEAGLVARLLANLFQLPESPGRTPLEDYEKAHHYQQHALALLNELGFQAYIALALTRLGNLALIQEELESAHTYFIESLAISQRIGVNGALLPGWKGWLGWRCLVEPTPDNSLARCSGGLSPDNWDCASH